MEHGTLRITRERSSWKDRGRSYRVFVDGERVAELPNGESADISLTPGEHTIRVRIDWTGSPEERFNVGAGESVSFSCRATGLGPLTMLRSVFSRERYVVLMRDT